jgi:hypothetical protein
MFYLHEQYIKAAFSPTVSIWRQLALRDSPLKFHTKVNEVHAIFMRFFRYFALENLMDIAHTFLFEALFTPKSTLQTCMRRIAQSRLFDAFFLPDSGHQTALAHVANPPSCYDSDTRFAFERQHCNGAEDVRASAMHRLPHS